MRIGTTSGGGSISMAAKIQKLFALIKEEAANGREGTLIDTVRPGLLNPHIPVREIKIIFGDGVVRHGLQIKISFDSERIFKAKAYLWRLVYDSDDAAADAIKSEQDIGISWERYFMGVPYSAVGTTKEGFQKMSIEDAIKTAAKGLGDFEGLLDELFKKISPH
jgi:hypothetical protein